MFKSNKCCILIIVFLLFLGCGKEIPRELIVLKTTYTYSGDTLDSTNVLLEHYHFNGDSTIEKYTNYKNGYFYLASYNKKKNTLNKKFYNLDSVFMYGSVTHLGKNDLEAKIKFYDSLNTVTYSIDKKYRKDHKIKKQVNKFSDGRIQQLLYEYDNKGNLVKLLSIKEQDTLIKENHIIKYDEKGRVHVDTVYYPDKRKIIENGYKNNKQLFISEKHEKKGDNDTSFIAKGNTYWKKYHIYDNNGNLLEIRNIQMFLYSNSFRLHSTISNKYDEKNNLIEETYFDIHKRKVYSIHKDYNY